MTTFQDPPLQSRRAARQGERPESSPPFAPPQTPRSPAGVGEPLSYVTQNRPPLPGYEAPAARGRRATPAAPETPTASPAETAPPAFRPRDYSPEARTAPPAWAPEYDRDSGVVEYHTQARASVAPPASLAESLSNEPNEQTLTRRELRQIREAHHITAVPTDATPIVSPEPAAPAAAPVQFPQAPVAPQQFAQPPAAPAPAPSATLDSAMAEFDALTSRSADATAAAPQRRGGRRAAAAPAVDEPTTGFVPRHEPAPAAPQNFVPQQAPQEFAPQGFSQQPPQSSAPPQPQSFAPPQAPVTQQPSAVTPEPLVEPAPAPVAPTTGERPVGHWTTQAQIDDETQVSESTISRRIGSGAITTNALVLPSLPGHDLTTGEVMLTGSINLPSSLAATGAHTPLDESDIDHLLDPGDHQLVNTDSVPIRAIKAVSSHTGARAQLIGTGKPPKSQTRALTALIASASVMVVVVVTLLVVALATDVL